MSIDVFLISDSTVIQWYNQWFNAKIKKLLQQPQNSTITLHFVYDRNGRLLQWSHHHFLPPYIWVKRFLKGDTLALLQNRYRLYYGKGQLHNDTLHLWLIPIAIRYPIYNPYLQPFYLFSYWFPYAPVSLSQQPCEQCIKLEGQSPRYFSLQYPAQLRAPWRLLLLLLALSCLLLFYKNHFLPWLFKRKPWQGILLLVLFWTSIRALFWFDALRNYLPSLLFSSQYLALSPLTASLGDLFLNQITIAAILHGCYLFHRRIRLKKLPALPWSLAIAILTGGLTATALYFYLQELGINSTLRFYFSLTQRWDWQHWVGFLSISLLLWNFLWFFFLLLSWIAFHYNIEQLKTSLQWQWLRWGIPITAVTLLVLSLFSQMLLGIFWAIILLLFLLLWWIRIYQGGGRWFQYPLFFFAFLSLSAAMLYSVGFYPIQQQRLYYQLKRLAERLNDPRDYFMEYQLKTLFKELRKAPLWRHYWKNPDSLAQTLLKHYLEPRLKGFFFQMGLYRYHWKPLSTSEAIHRYKNTFVLLSRGRHPKRLGLQPLSRYVYMKRKGATVQYWCYALIYTPQWGYLHFILVVYPPPVREHQPYHQLLLDQYLWNKLKIPPATSYAIYVNGKLQTYYGQHHFPYQWDSIPTTPWQQLRIHQQHYEYQLAVPQQKKLIVIHHSGWTWWQVYFQIVQLFYLYFLCLLAFQGITILSLYRFRLKRLWKRYSGLRYRLLLLLLFFTFLPLLILIGVSLPLFQTFYQSVIENQLSNELLQVRNYLYNQGLLWKRLDFSALERLSTIIRDDITWYDARGRLLYSTQMEIFKRGLLAPIMAPKAFQAANQVQPLILEETIGKLRYYAGYIALHHPKTGVLKAFIQVPNLTKMEAIQERIQAFWSTILGFYLFFAFLVLGVNWLFANRLLAPLRTLQRHFAKLGYGARYEPIQWEALDEIGQLIRSYNRMLNALKESEKRFRAQERALAWQRMARQIAHEIKNPLTPIKLHLQILQTKFKNDPKNYKRIQTLLEQVDNLAATANLFSEYAKLLDGSYWREKPKKLISLHKLLKNLYEFYAGTSPIAFELDLPQKEVFLLSHEEALQRIFINLIKNAMEAIDEPEKGKISIRLQETSEAVVVVVEDNGCGIPSSIQDKIFEPHFTTRSSGTGLGLAIVRELIEHLEGRIQFESQEGKGTVFYVYFSKNFTDKQPL